MSVAAQSFRMYKNKRNLKRVRKRGMAKPRTGEAGTNKGLGKPNCGKGRGNELKLLASLPPCWCPVVARG